LTLYANGDSHTAGININLSKSFAKITADTLNLELVNQAKVGASNARIIRTTKEYLKENTPSLVMIGWSTWEREEWSDQHGYYDVNSSGHDRLPEYLQQQYKQWVTEQTSDMLTIKSQSMHREIYELHTMLDHLKIPHVFFNCMYDFFSIQDPLDWNGNHIGPYQSNLSYYWYLKEQGFETDAWYHYKEDGHQAWADFLIKYIKEHNII
jgi:hypothetical protein